MQRDASADRASDQDRPVEFERGHDVEDHRRVLRRGELIFLVVPARRRRRLAMPGHVEGDDAVPASLGHYFPDDSGLVYDSVGGGERRIRDVSFCLSPHLRLNAGLG
jgi:hypothetical protein